MAARPDSTRGFQDADSRYPRRIVRRAVRTALRYWWLLLITYAGIVLRNVLVLVSGHGFGAVFNPAHVGRALPSLRIAAEPWGTLLVVVGLSVLFFAGRIAHRDYEQEHEVLSRREIESVQRAARDEAQQAARGAMLTLVEQTIRRSMPSVPLSASEQVVPFEQERLSPPREARERPVPLRRRSKHAGSAPFDQDLLPAPGYLVGHAQTLQWLTQRLRDRRQPGWTILYGPHGSDKSALAAQVVHAVRAEGRFDGGVGVVLCNHCDPVEPLELLRRALARFDPQRRWLDGATFAELADAAHYIFANKDRLVILQHVDNAERVEQVIDVLASAGAQVLVLALHGLPPERVPEDAQRESEYLSITEGVNLLFRQMERGERPTSQAERQAARDIVQGLGGNSQAIALAAYYALSANITVRQLKARLNEALARETWDDFPHSIGAALQLNLRSLPPGARLLLTSLTAFETEEFGTQAVDALGRALGIEQPSAAIGALARSGLLDRWEREDLPPESDWHRLRLHPLLVRLLRREFDAWSNERRATANLAIARWYAKYAHGKTPHVVAADQRNITGSIDWALSHREQRLIAELCENMQAFWVVRWRTQECLNYLPKGIEAAAELAGLSAVAARADDLRRLADLKLALARVHQRLGFPEQALHELQENLHARREQHDRPGEALVLRALGKLEWSRSNLRAAEPFFTEALQLARETNNRKLQGACWGDLGRLAQARGDLTRAAECYQLSRTLAEEEDDRAGKSKVLFQLSQIMRAQGALDEAERLVDESIAISRARGDRQGEAQGLWQRGNIALDRGQVDEAQRDYQDSLDYRREVRDLRGEATCLTYLGIVALLLNRLPEAEEHLSQAIAIAERICDDRAKGIALSQLARIAQRREQWKPAETKFKRALNIARAVENRRGEAVDLLELGGIAARLGNIDTALERLEEAAAIAVAINDTPTQARASAALGHLYRQRGDEPSAERWYQRALEADRLLHDDHNAAADLIFLGQMANARHDSDAAAEHFDKARQVSNAAGNRRVESAALSALGQLEAARGDLDRAREYIDQALDIDHELGDQRSEALDLVTLAELARSAGNQVGAVALYDQAFEIQRAQRDKLAVAISLFDLSTTSREEGDVEIELDRLIVAHVGFVIAKAPQATLTAQLLSELRARAGDQAYADALSRVAHATPEIAYDLDQAAWEAQIMALLDVAPSAAAVATI